jgi:hypothetical protein
VKILPVTLFRGLVTAFQKPPMTILNSMAILKLFPKPTMNGHWRNSTNGSDGKLEHKFDAAY